MTDKRIALPDGSVGIFPADMPDEQIQAVLQKQFPPQPQGKSVEGFVQNIGTDAYNTGASILGSISDAAHKVVSDPRGAAQDVAGAVDTSGKLISGTLGHAWNQFADQPLLSVNGQEVISNPASKMTPGEDMELAGKVGSSIKDRYWDNLGNTLYEHPVQSALDVGTLAMGGESLATRALGEGAMLTKGARTAAALTNPVNIVTKPVNALRGAMAESKALRQMRKGAPTQAENAANTKAAYDDLKARGVSVPADEFARANENIKGIGQINASDAQRSHALAVRMRQAQASSESALAAEAQRARAAHRELSATGHPDAQQAGVAAQKAEARAKLGKAVYFDELDDFRKQASAIANDKGLSVSQTDRAAAQQIIKQIDDILGSTAGSPEVLAARELARRNIIARDLSEMERKKAWYLSGSESGTRNQLSSYGKKSGKGLTELEEKEAKKLVHREGFHGVLNTTGSKLVQAMLLSGLGMGVGWPAAVAGLGVNAATRAASAAMTNRQIKRLMQTVLAGKDAQAEALARSQVRQIPSKGPLGAAEAASIPDRVKQERLARALLEETR